jgi:hypothetical protein
VRAPSIADLFSRFQPPAFTKEGGAMPETQDFFRDAAARPGGQHPIGLARAGRASRTRVRGYTPCVFAALAEAIAPDILAGIIRAVIESRIAGGRGPACWRRKPLPRRH